MQQGQFNRYYSQYYNLFYSDKNYPSEVEYIDRTIQKFGPASKSILEYGSGTGGHGLILKKKGYVVVGIERSEQMAQIAQSKGLDCHVGDITQFTLEKKFDVCMALFHVVSYINSNESLIQLFENTRRHLVPGGLFIFDVWFSPAVFHQKPEVRVKRISSDNIEIVRIAEPVIHAKQNVVDVNYQVLVKDLKTNLCEAFSESHSMRHFSIPEIDLLTRQTGFLLLSAEEFLTGKEPSVDTWGVNFVLKVK